MLLFLLVVIVAGCLVIVFGFSCFAVWVLLRLVAVLVLMNRYVSYGGYSLLVVLITAGWL